MGVRSRRSNRKRPRAAIASVGDGSCGGGVDLISGLNDDLLLRILGLVRDAEHVVRTHALSRRWRGLWTGVTALRFDFDSYREFCGSDAAAERYVAFVNGALALRAAAGNEPAFVEDLAISFDIDELSRRLVPLSVEAVQGWIRYAAHHAVKSFIVKLRLPWVWLFNVDRDDNGIVIERPVNAMTLDEMGNHVKMEAMHLDLGGAQLRLPSSTVVFPSLVDLSLEGIMVSSAGGAYLLSCLVSSACCPRLRKLRLRRLVFGLSTKVVLRIEASTLLELLLDAICELQLLELRTPSLQVLNISRPFELEGFTVSAPRLENLKFWVQKPLHIDDVHGHLSNVGTLDIIMFSHGETDVEDRNDGSIHLLQCCRLTRCLEVSFEIPKTKYQTVDIIKGRIPLLPCVTHLAVNIRMQERHSTGPGIAYLLAQCNNIKCLRLQLHYFITEQNQQELDLLCDNNSCHWKSHEFSSLAHL